MDSIRRHPPHHFWSGNNKSGCGVKSRSVDSRTVSRVFEHVRNDLNIAGLAHRDHPYRLQQVEPIFRFCVD
jgi:hypothetical protein